MTNRDSKMNRVRIQAALFAAFMLAATGPLAAEVVALVGGTVHPVTGPAIEDGVVVMENGRILQVGSDVEIPEDAREVDVDGLHLYPGFIHPATSLGLTEISSVAGTVDLAEIGNINAAVRAEVAVNHDSELFPATIAGGVLSAHMVPGGGLIRGTSAVMNLDGWSWEEMVISTPVAMHLDFPRDSVDNEDSDELAAIEKVLDQARHWHKARRAADENDSRPPVRNDQLEALGPMLDGEVPLMIHANRSDVMEAALDWAEEQELERIILVANADAQYLAERLAAEDIPVILRNVYAMPTRRWEPHDMAFRAPARLHEAGVRFAIADSGGGLDVANSRNLPFHAGSAMAHGLPAEAALKSVTRWPAEILGVDGELGALEPGLRASLFAATGDPLEPMSRIERVWIDGQEYDLSRKRGRELYHRYRERNRSVRQGD